MDSPVPWPHMELMLRTFGPLPAAFPHHRCWEKPVAPRWPDGGETGGSGPVRYEHAALARLSGTVRSAEYEAALVNVPWNLIPSSAQ